MAYNNINDNSFLFRYSQVRMGLKDTTKKFIETMFMFTRIDGKYIEEIPKNNVLNKLEELDEALKYINDEDLFYIINNLYNVLEIKVLHNEDYDNLLIKLCFMLGIYPDEYFLEKAKRMFYHEIYLKIIDGTFKEDKIFTDKEITSSFVQASKDNSIFDNELSNISYGEINSEILNFEKEKQTYTKKRKLKLPVGALVAGV